MTDVYAAARTVDHGGVSLTVTDHGPSDGVPVLLIHGFPDSARLWRHQIPALADAGYRVLAPDMRGFGRSDKPLEVEAYAMRTLGSDMVALLDDAGVDKAHVVGHDWGAGVAWYMAIALADRLRTMTALSVGHPTSFNSAGYRQREKSWYMLLFQAEGVAEDWLSRDDWKALRSWTRSGPEIDHWIEDLSRPGALSAALGVYRANVSPASFVAPPPNLPPISVPTMGIWSSGDMALTEEQMTGSEPYVASEWRYERIEDASHWIPVDTPDLLNDRLMDWFSAHRV